MLYTTKNRQAESTDLESGYALRHDEIDGQSHQFRGEFGHTSIISSPYGSQSVCGVDTTEISCTLASAKSA
jgi:hypothetical protein